MRYRALRILVFFVLLIVVSQAGVFTTRARDGDRTLPTPRIHNKNHLDKTPATVPTDLRRAAAALDTFVLAEYTFHGEFGPEAQGWTSREQYRTLDQDTFFHVADTTQLDGGDIGRLIVLEGDRSMWCGAAASDSGSVCNYSTLPGYGNNWEQFFTSIKFPRSGDVTLTYLIIWDSEPGEDYTYVYFRNKDGDWQHITSYSWFAQGQTVVLESFVLPDSALGDSVQVRFNFHGDGAWSDEDGLWPTDGAVIIDSLTIADTTGVLDFQDFEAEPVGAKATNDGHWQAGVPGGFGNFTGLYSGLGVLQEDGCREETTGLWGFFEGSTDDYSCGGHPEQLAVPMGTPSYNEGYSISNEILSPAIDWHHDVSETPIPATTETAILEFDVYRDLPIDNLVFYQWKVRSIVDGCAGKWFDDNYVYYGDYKNWYRHRIFLAPYVAPDAQEIQIALKAVDMCYMWCGVYGDGSCHSHAPLFDNVRVIRAGPAGPSWLYQPWELFTDNFSTDSTLTGTVKINGAHTSGGQTYDAAYVRIASPVGIDYHIPGDINSGSAAYCHVKDVSPAKSGSIVSGDLARYPFISAAGGWTTIQCYRSTSSNTNIRYEIDLNDDLWVPGDTVLYYFSARDKNGVTNYWSLHTGAVQTESDARLRPMEMTCLPANALTGATDILYIDGCDGYGSQPYFDTAFEMLGLTPDRYDVQDPEYIPGGGPGLRVRDVLQQLAGVYKKIIYDTGYLRNGGIHDGTGFRSFGLTPDDFGMLFEFIDQSPNSPGLYLCGDNLASMWITKTGSGAVSLRNNYMNFTVVGDAHTDLAEPASPFVIGLPGSHFDHGSGNVDSLIAFGGGCSGINDFDVLQAQAAAELQMAYSGNASRGAVVSQITANSAGDTARVILSGFGFNTIRDYATGSPPVRAEHLAEILRWLGNAVGDPVGQLVRVTPANTLGKNYPNPFNPSTTITFTVKTLAEVDLTIYDVSGRRIKHLVSGLRSPGMVHTITWHGTNESGQSVASGVYFYRLRTPDFSATRKMVLLK